MKVVAVKSRDMVDSDTDPLSFGAETAPLTHLGSKKVGRRGAAATGFVRLVIKDGSSCAIGWTTGRSCRESNRQVLSS